MLKISYCRYDCLFRVCLFVDILFLGFVKTGVHSLTHMKQMRILQKIKYYASVIKYDIVFLWFSMKTIIMLQSLNISWFFGEYTLATTSDTLTN